MTDREEMNMNAIENTNASPNGRSTKKTTLAEKSGDVKAMAFGKIHCNKDLNFRSDTVKRKVKETAESIKEHGLLEPMVVYPNADGTFDVGIGFKRYAALVMNGTKPTDLVNVVIRTDRANRPIENLIENLHREDLPTIDLANAFKELIEGTYSVVDGEEVRKWTRKELAEKTGLSQTTVENYVRSATNLSEDVQDIVRENNVPARIFIEFASKKPEIQLEKVKDWVKANPQSEDGPKRKRKGKGKSKSDGPSRASVSNLKLEMEIIAFKAEHAKGGEKAVLERQFETLRYVVGDLARMPGITGDDKKEFARAQKDALAEDEEEEGGDEE